MSSTKLVKSYPLLVIPNVAVGGPFTTPNVDTQFYDDVGFQISWSATATGPFVFQASLDSGVTWTAMDVKDEFGNPPAATGAPGSILIRLTEIPYPFVRVLYTNSSGTGSMLIQLSAKEL